MNQTESYYNNAMTKYKEKKYKDVIKEMNMYLNEDRRNGIDARGMFGLAKSYSYIGNKSESIKIYRLILKLSPKDVYARLELGKLYVGQGKEKEAEKLLNECMELDQKDVHARLELGRLYALQGKIEASQSLYEYIIDKIGDEAFDEENRAKHIIKHMKDDKTKEQHGVLVRDPFEILEDIKKQMIDENKKVGYMSDIYLIKSKGCGYEGGKKGDNHTLDYITVVTLPNSNKFITMFPSDNIFELDKEEKPEKNSQPGDDEVGEER